MRAIIACNSLNFIGLDNKLPWKCSEDLKHFKSLTVGQKLLAGYNTFNSLPPLKDREVFCDVHMNRAFHILDTDEIKQKTEDHLKILSQIDWCIGGKKTYEKYCHLFTELHISYINDDTIGDTTFPDLSNLNKDCKIFKYHFEVDRVLTKLEVIDETIEFIRKSDRVQHFYEINGCFCAVGRCLNKKGLDYIKANSLNGSEIDRIFDLSFFKSAYQIDDKYFWADIQYLNDRGRYWVEKDGLRELTLDGNDYFYYLKNKYAK